MRRQLDFAEALTADVGRGDDVAGRIGDTQTATRSGRNDQQANIGRGNTRQGVADDQLGPVLNGQPVVESLVVYVSPASAEAVIKRIAAFPRQLRKILRQVIGHQHTVHQGVADLHVSHRVCFQSEKQVGSGIPDPLVPHEEPVAIDRRGRSQPEQILRHYFHKDDLWKPRKKGLGAGGRVDPFEILAAAPCRN